MSEGNSQFESTHFAGDYRLGKVEILTSSSDNATYSVPPWLVTNVTSFTAVINPEEILRVV